jgi:hypothetical protein
VIEKTTAKEVHKHGMDSIKSLSLALEACESRCSPDELESIMERAVGLSISRIETELYKAYPELDAESC